MIKAGVLLVACSGLVGAVGMQPSAASPGSASALGEPTSALGPLPDAAPVAAAPVRSTGRTTTAVEGPTVSRQALVIGTRAQQLARGQLGQLGFVGVTVVVPVVAPAPVAARPAARTSRSATRDAVPGSDESSGSRSTPSTSRSDVKATSGSAVKAQAGSDRNADSLGAQQPVTDEPSAGDGPGSSSFGAAVIAIASRYKGTPYRYGGTTPAGFDCSGFTGYVMAKLGYALPRTSGAQRAATQRLPRSQAVAGDLVFMPGHVGIYAGNGMMIDSPRTGSSVSLRPVYSASATYGRIG